MAVPPPKDRVPTAPDPSDPVLSPAMVQVLVRLGSATTRLERVVAKLEAIDPPEQESEEHDEHS